MAPVLTAVVVCSFGSHWALRMPSERQSSFPSYYDGIARCRLRRSVGVAHRVTTLPPLERAAGGSGGADPRTAATPAGHSWASRPPWSDRGRGGRLPPATPPQPRGPG